jgi:hypothetical protein
MAHDAADRAGGHKGPKDFVDTLISVSSDQARKAIMSGTNFTIDSTEEDAAGGGGASSTRLLAVEKAVEGLRKDMQELIKRFDAPGTVINVQARPVEPNQPGKTELVDAAAANLLNLLGKERTAAQQASTPLDSDSSVASNDIPKAAAGRVDGLLLNESSAARSAASVSSPSNPMVLPQRSGSATAAVTPIVAASGALGVGEGPPSPLPEIVSRSDTEARLREIMAGAERSRENSPRAADGRSPTTGANDMRSPQRTWLERAEEESLGQMNLAAAAASTQSAQSAQSQEPPPPPPPPSRAPKSPSRTPKSPPSRTPRSGSGLEGGLGQLVGTATAVGGFLQKLSPRWKDSIIPPAATPPKPNSTWA